MKETRIHPPVAAVPPGVRSSDPIAVLGLGAMLALGLSAVLFVLGESRTAASIPAALAGAYVVVRWPPVAIGGALLLLGAQLPLDAYLGVPVGGAIDGALASLWLGVAWMLYRQEGERIAWLWPGLVVLFLYPVLSALAIPAADSIQIGLDSFRFSAWHVLAFFAVAIAPWPARAYPRIAQAVVAVLALIAVYGAFRKLAGSGAEELRVARTYAIGLASSEPVPFFGSFFTNDNLGQWMALTIPFALAMGLAWRGRWRLLAAVAVGAGIVALLAADRRNAIVGVVVGCLLVLLLFALAERAFGGRRLGVTLVALCATLTAAVGAYAVTIAQDPERIERFEGLVTAPTEQETLKIRQARWEAAIEAAEEHPFGVGLGEVGVVPRLRSSYDDEYIGNLDSSYLKIAYEQGFPVLILFAAGLAVLLIGLAVNSLRTSDRARSAIGIGACGTLAAMLPVLYATFLIESLVAIAGWMLVGLGAAQFTRVRDPQRPPPMRSVRQ